MKKLLIFLLLFSITSGMVGAEELAVEEQVMGTVKMEGEFLDGDLLHVRVLAQEMMSPVLGLAFHLEYPVKDLAFLRYEPGSFLEKGGDPFYLVKDKPEAESIIFGETLRHDDAFPLGDGEVVDLYFQVIGERELELSFDKGVVSTMDTVRQDIDKIEWKNFYIDENSGTLSPSKSAAIQADSLSSSINKYYLAWSIGGFLLAVGVVIFLLVKQPLKIHG